MECKFTCSNNISEESGKNVNKYTNASWIGIVSFSKEIEYIFQKNSQSIRKPARITETLRGMQISFYIQK